MKIYDVIGIGVGPSNLSTAALIKPFSSKLSSIFFDHKKEFSWHPGLMFPDAKLQVSILKDLVTMIDPTNKFSFLNYLKEERKLYIFAARNGFSNVKRKEFEAYLKWVVSKLDNLYFNSNVEEIDHTGELFKVKVNSEIFETRNILMGAGLTSNIPNFCRSWLSSTLFHSSQFLKQYNNYRGKSVAIIGDGQSSCEILKFILENDDDSLPSRINWIFRNHRLNLLEDTPFANELYTPNYSEYIYSLEKNQRTKLIEQEKYTSDGVSGSMLNEIYDLLYYMKFNTKCEISIYNDSSLTDLKKENEKYFMSLNNESTIESEIVILGTGFYYQIPKCIERLSKEYYIEDGVFKIDKKFRLIPKSNIKGSIFIHNGAKHVRGIADPNLSLVAWRSGVIINTLLNSDIYNISDEMTIIDWKKK
ncbi:lysine N6-hydroxylase [Chitinophaga sp. CF118]|uniref:lysine N(6)-hydroxylase/L-ornithine N(5)-oxygenase family protein n=1 Tax=Chitinophaga sp. CF118 TaxID=1884367 RepID=UPI0008DF0DA9|nr:SidA/IucD/PvdA family monooxygenase [Chitinophaga sp. CF118]SFD00804.1 lysine N6-hydroxylase [Chitinophaga sp. CF118]